jgi:hypothetical protein
MVHVIAGGIGMKHYEYGIMDIKELGRDTQLTIARCDGLTVTVNIPFDYLYKPNEMVHPSGPFGLNLVFGAGDHYE